MCIHLTIEKNTDVAEYETLKDLSLTSNQLNGVQVSHLLMWFLNMVVMGFNRTASLYSTILFHHPEWRHRQAVYMCHLAGHLSVTVPAAPSGALHRRWLCQLHTLPPSGHLPLPGNASSEAKVLLCLDTWWVSYWSTNFSHPFYIKSKIYIYFLNCILLLVNQTGSVTVICCCFDFFQWMLLVI